MSWTDFDLAQKFILLEDGSPHNVGRIAMTGHEAVVLREPGREAARKTEGDVGPH